MLVCDASIASPAKCVSPSLDGAENANGTSKARTRRTNANFMKSLLLSPFGVSHEKAFGDKNRIHNGKDRNMQMAAAQM